MDVATEAQEHERWHAYKLYLRRKQKRRYFSERQIWWSACGFNIGDEENGKGDKFLRPVLVVRKFNANLFLGVPFTGRMRVGKYYFPVSTKRGFSSTLILSQIRAYDSRRLLSRIDLVDKSTFEDVKKKLRGVV